MALFEHLKKLFGDKAMTADEFEAAYKAQESSKDGVKLANLTEGGVCQRPKVQGQGGGTGGRAADHHRPAGHGQEVRRRGRGEAENSGRDCAEEI